jgi:hypothetical protein
MRRGLPLTVGAVVIGVMAAGLVALRAQAGPGGCRSGDPMTNVRDPGRLKVLSRCEQAGGVVQETRAEPDGDIDVFLRPDPGSVHLVGAGNRRWLGGSLLLEIIPADQPWCRPGQRVAYGTCTGANVHTPKVGSHVSVTGPHVYDRAHDHNEIHPVWRLASSGDHRATVAESGGGAPQNVAAGESEDADSDADTDAAPAAGAAPSPVQYIGLEFPPVAVPQEFPAGVEHLDQILLVDADRDPGTPAADMVERVRKDGWDMIWLERSDDAQRGLVRVVDAVVLPSRSPGEFFTGPGSCATDGTPDPTVGAIVHLGGDSASATVSRAWRFDRRAGAITPLPITGLACRLRAHD